jgi:DNA-binding CsgD family transcriptional regulator
MVGYILYVRGRLREAAGDLHGAADDFRASGELQLRWGDISPAGVAWRSSLGLTLHALDRTNEGAGLIEEELQLATRFGALRTVGVALRAQALLLRGEAAIAGLKEAARVLAVSPARLEHARVLVDLGAALRRSGRRTEARDVLRSRLDAADRCGAHQLAARARSELTTAGARPRRERITGPEALTASERRVAQMAAEGLTNRQIAQALFVTTKTIEMHLARVYAKLEIKHRGDLPAALAAAQ